MLQPGDLSLCQSVPSTVSESADLCYSWPGPRQLPDGLSCQSREHPYPTPGPSERHLGVKSLVPHLNTISFLDSGSHFPDLVGKKIFVSQYCSPCLCSSGTHSNWGVDGESLIIDLASLLFCSIHNQQACEVTQLCRPSPHPAPRVLPPHKMKFYCPVNVYSSNVYEACCYSNKMLWKRTQMKPRETPLSHMLTTYLSPFKATCYFPVCTMYIFLYLKLSVG